MIFVFILYLSSGTCNSCRHAYLNSTRLIKCLAHKSSYIIGKDKNVRNHPINGYISLDMGYHDSLMVARPIAGNNKGLKCLVSISV